MGEPMHEDELLAMLRALPDADMDPRRAREVRDRACATLGRRQRPAARWLEALAVFYDQLVEPVLVGALAAGFLAWVAGRCVEALSKGSSVFF
jgi:hypothetical protein